MSQKLSRNRALLNPGRRRFFSTAGATALSAGAIALIAGRDSLAAGNDTDPAQDVAILNVALGLEHEGINAYQLGAESGLLEKPVLDVAVTFQGHHKEHRDALIAAIQKLGGTPVQELPIGDYAAALNADQLKTQTDVLNLAARLEKGAANAYLGVIPAFVDPTFGQICARLATDETMHWTVLAQALGQPLPQMAFSFGA